MTFGIFTTFPTEAVVLCPHPLSTHSPLFPLLSPPAAPCVVVHGNCVVAVASKIEMKGTSSRCGVERGRGAWTTACLRAQVHSLSVCVHCGAVRSLSTLCWIMQLVQKLHQSRDSKLPESRLLDWKIVWLVAISNLNIFTRPHKEKLAKWQTEESQKKIE